MRQPFSLHKRPLSRSNKYVYYCQFWSSETGKYGTAVSTGCTAKAAALEWARNQLTNPNRSKKIVKFHDFAADFWNYEKSLRIQAKNARGRSISRSYCDIMDGLCRNHLSPIFGEKTLASISVAEIERWVLKLREKLAPVSVNHALSCLKIMLKEAARQSLITGDPAAKVEELRDDCRKR